MKTSEIKQGAALLVDASACNHALFNFMANQHSARALSNFRPIALKLGYCIKSWLGFSSIDHLIDFLQTDDYEEQQHFPYSLILSAIICFLRPKPAHSGELFTLHNVTLL